MILDERLPALLADTVLPFGWKPICTADERGFWYMQITDLSAIDNVTGAPTTWRGRKWLLSEHMTDGEIIQTAFLATMTAAEHEMRELFTYRGQAIFDPHYDVQKLVALRAQPDALKERS